MAAVFTLPFVPALDANGVIVSGAQLFFYEPGTLTPKDVYTTAALTTAHANPVVASSAGLFPAIYIDPNQTYRVILKTSAGVTLGDVDNYGTVADDQVITVDDYGADPTGATDSTAAITAYVDALGSYGTMRFGPGIYKFNLVLTAKLGIVGAGRKDTILKSNSAGGIIVTYAAPGDWDYVEVADVSFEGDSGTYTGTGVQFGRSPYVSYYDTHSPVAFNRVGMRWLDKCVARMHGNLGVTLNDCSFEGANYHIWSQDTGVSGAETAMHAGCMYVNRGEYHGAQLAHFYMNATLVDNGQVVYDNVIVEGNPGFAFFVKSFAGYAHQNPIEFRNMWMEANASAASVTIDGVSYTTRDFYFRNVHHAVFRDTALSGSIELLNSTVITYSCGDVFQTVIKDADSALLHFDPRTRTQATSNREYHSTILGGEGLNTTAASWRIGPRTVRSGNWTQWARYVHDCTSGLRGSSSASGTLTSTPVWDAELGGISQEITTAGADTFQPYTQIDGASTFTIPAGKWMVALLTAKFVSGSGFTTAVITGSTQLGNFNAATNGFHTTVMQQFETVAILGKNQGADANVGFYFSTEGITTMRFGGMCAFAFDTKQQALEFLYSDAFPLPPNALLATTTYDPPSLAAGVQDAIQTLALPGAMPGDVVDASFTNDLAGVALRAWVAVGGSAKFVFDNRTAAAVDLASGTVTLKVRR